jgi:hypothetical protein
MRKVWMVLVLLCASAGVASAQKAEVAGGYSYMNLDTGVSGVDRVNLNGWNASVAGYPVSWFGLVGDFSGNYGSPTVLGVTTATKVHTYLFGPRISLRGVVTPFAHALFGGARARTTVAGVSSYVRTQFSNSNQNHMRYSAGIVLRW